MTSPTSRSLAKLRASGYICQVVERWCSFSRRRIDLYNFIDILCISPSEGIIGVQTTSGGNFNARLDKIMAEPKAGIFMAAGGKILLHGWAKKGPRGKRKLWECREMVIGKEAV